MTNPIGTRDRIVNTDGGGSGGGGAVTQATTPWIVDDPDTQTALATIFSKLADILTELQGAIDVIVTGTVSVANFPASQPISGTVEVTNDVGNPLPVNGTVSVGNFPSSVEVSNDAGNPLPISGTVTANLGTIDGAATAANQATLIGKVPDEEGTWDYRAGASGTVVIPALGRVLGIAASTAQSGGTVTINGGDAIPIPVPSSGVGAVDIAPRANLIAPSIVFVNVDSHLVEFVT